MFISLMSSRGIARVIVFVLAAVATGASFAQEKTTIMVDWSPHGMHAALHLAVVKGWFKEAGLNVEVLDGKGSGATIQQVAAKKVDIGFAQLATMAAAISNGLPVTSIMGFVRAGDNGFLVPIDAGYHKLTDLKGKKIAIPNGSGTAPFLDAFLTAGGLSRNDVQLVNVDSQSMVSTYTSGQVDAALSTVAFFVPIVSSVRPSTGILFSDVGLRLPGYGLVVRKDMITEHPDILAKVVAVNKRAWDYIFAGHEEEAVDAIMTERANVRPDRKVLLGQLKMYMPLFDTPATKGKPRGWQADEDWRSALAAMEKAGVVKPGWQTSTYYTNQFIPQ